MNSDTLRGHLRRLDDALREPAALCIYGAAALMLMGQDEALGRMTAREKLQLAYELAFHPARLNDVWNQWERDAFPDLCLLLSVVDWALALHQRLPEAPAVSARALRRLARYQASSRLYRLPTMLSRFREKLGSTDPIPPEVPAWMVRDIGLPLFGRIRVQGTAARSGGTVLLSERYQSPERERRVFKKATRVESRAQQAGTSTASM